MRKQDWVSCEEKMENGNNPLISVIVPVYNVEPYLRRCLDSILAQTYENLEIILVDDGSPDRCGEICDEYARLDQRVKVYHKQNGGLSDARNYGTERALGKYIAYIDSDDFVAENYLAYLFTLLEENRADISLCAVLETKNSEAAFSQTEDAVVLPGLEACKGGYDRDHIYYRTAWGKLLKIEIAKKYPYPKGRIHEDEATIVKYYYEAERVAVGYSRLYAYFQNQNGIIRSLGDAKNEDKLWAFAHAATFFEEKGESGLSKVCWKRYFAHCLSDSVEHNDRCYEDIKAYAKLKRLNMKMLFHVPLYLTAPKLYGVFARAYLERHRKK